MEAYVGVAAMEAASNDAAKEKGPVRGLQNGKSSRAIYSSKRRQTRARSRVKPSTGPAPTSVALVTMVVFISGR